MTNGTRMDVRPPLRQWSVTATYRSWFPSRLRLVSCLALVPSLSACGESWRWEHERSDIPADRRIQFGELENGLRFAWAFRPRPEGRLFLRMYVGVGSLHEKHDELGMAHFVEHLAFHGSQALPEEKLRDWYSQRGMTFGADVNAETSHYDTVYELDLMGNSLAHLKEGLEVFHSFATDLPFRRDLVDLEKEVVDAEEIASVEEQAERSAERIGLAGSRYSLRPPLGERQTRRAFTSEGLRAFHERWYRPDNVTLLLVGDFQKPPDSIIRSVFGSWRRPDSRLVKRPDVGRLTNYGAVFVVRDENLPTVTLRLERRRPAIDEPYDRAHLRAGTALEAARSMLGARFSDMIAYEDVPFLASDVTAAIPHSVVTGERVSVECSSGSWQVALERASREIRRAVVHGFHEQELDRFRTDFIQGLDRAVEAEETEPSSVLVEALVLAARFRWFPTNADTYREILAPAIEELTPEACRLALRRAWSRGQLSIHAIGNLDPGSDASALRAAFEAGWSAPVEPLIPRAEPVFAYASHPGVQGVIVERNHVEDLDLYQLRFENGVSINIRPTDFERGQVLLRVVLGEGLLTLRPEEVAVGTLAEFAIEGCGLGSHDAQELETILAGRDVTIDLTIGQGSSWFDASTTENDLLLQSEVLCALFIDPGWRPEGFAQTQRMMPEVLEMAERRLEGPLFEQFLSALYSGDLRGGFQLGWVPTKHLATVALEDIREWFAPQLAEAPIEVTVVGDVEIDSVIETMARTFGTLPPRRSWEARPEGRKLAPPVSGLKQEHSVPLGGTRALVVLTYPATDGIDARVRWRLESLQLVLQERIRAELRDALGLVYSPIVKLELNDTHPGVGLLVVTMETNNDSVEEVVEAVLRTCNALAEAGISQGELNYVKHVLVGSLTARSRSNQHWVQGLCSAQRSPDSLDALRIHDRFVTELTKKSLDSLARRFLKRERASVFVSRSVPGRSDAPESDAKEPAPDGARRRKGAKGER